MWKIARSVVILAALAAGVAHGQQPYPGKPVRVVLPFAAGSTTDTVARVVAHKASANTGAQFVVDARPGANGIVGVDGVAKALADGYTIVLASNGTHGINSSLFARLPYDPVGDFTPIMRLGYVPYLLVAGTGLPVDSVKDLVAITKANPGRYTLAATASVGQLTGELFKLTAGISMLHVPYKTPPQAFADLIGGQVDALFEPVTSALPHVKAGRIKALAVTSSVRSTLVPDTPTIAESGYPGFESTAWIAFFGPRGLPGDAVSWLNTELARAANSVDTREKLAQAGLEVATTTPEALGELVKAEMAKWQRVFAEAKLPRQ
jgi:tripartite-type tricarboxylate transporter receptor subunit TctC